MDNSQNYVKVSIVMPVFNTAPYLMQCLDSVLAQTLKEFELICVDDGSTDGSLEILEEYAEKDSRIKILKQQNQYAGVARNNGLKIAKGEYVIFLDSDDVFADVLLEHTYNAGVGKRADIVLFDILSFDNKTKKKICTYLKHDLLPEKEIFSKYDIPNTIFSVNTPGTFSGIYRRGFITEYNLQFQALPNSNDVYFTLYARALAKRITIVDEPLVYYRKNREGSAQSGRKVADPACFLEAYYALYQVLMNDGVYEDLKPSFQYSLLDNINYNLNSAKTTDARFAILQMLDEEPYCNLPIDGKAEAGYEFKEIVQYENKLKAMRAWYHKNRDAEQKFANCKVAKPTQDNNKIKVSVILPVYNTAPYLRQCLDSIMAQTLKEFELICVDDGSTDGSVEILEEYAKKDSRIKILKQQNQHAGVARNNGLKVAKGEYVIFLDSDDVFADVLLEHTYSAGVEKKADIVLFDFSRFDHNTKETQRTTISHVAMPDKEIFSWCDIPDDIFSITPPNTFAGIYRREFLSKHKLHFQDLPNAEDVYFTQYARALAERITIVDEPLVYYRKNRPGSLETENKNANSTCFLQAFYALYSDLVKDGLFEPLKKAFQSRFFNTLIYNLNSVKTTKARLAILQALDEEPYCNLPIDEKLENFGKNKTLIQYFNEIKAAREWYHKNLRINQLGEDLKNTKTAPPIEEQGTITVSVIIPVYNTKDYLREALDSIVSQTLKDIEIICVNDGSTDGSAGILEEYARKDNRISIITQENKGLSCARNAGIMAAKGKYIYFMDSDDILETTALEELIPIMEEKNLDVLHFDGESFTENPELVTPYFKTAYKRNKAYNDVYEGAELLKLFRQENKYAPVVWLQVYKISLLRENDIYFIPGILHEDNAFTFSVFLNAKRASHTDKIYFHRRLRENSIVNTKTSFINVYSYYKSYQEMVKTYNFAFGKLTNENADYALNCIASALNSAQYQYSLLPEEKLGSELGITEDLFSFKRLVVSSANEAKYKEKLNNSWERNNELKEKLQTSWQRNDELKEKLQTSWQRNSELKEKIKNSRQRKNELKEKLDNSKQKNSEYKKRLEKSKKENKALKKKLKAARDENKRIKNSRAYKIGRIIMYIPKKLRMIFKK